MGKGARHNLNASRFAVLTTLRARGESRFIGAASYAEELVGRGLVEKTGEDTFKLTDEGAEVIEELEPSPTSGVFWELCVLKYRGAALIEANPEMGVKELAERLGVSKVSTREWLEEAGHGAPTQG